jgi:signal transduction histidine kinase
MKLFRRWRYVVDWRSQIGTAVQIVAVLAGICLVCSVAIKYVKQDDALELMSGDSVRNFLYRITAAQFLVSAVTLTILAVYLTHRFAGPAFALERQLRAILNGRTERKMQLRARDYLKTLAAAIEDLRVREEARKKQLADLGHCLAEGDVAGAREIHARLATPPAPAMTPEKVADPANAPAAQC